jgi:hypothetical protein
MTSVHVSESLARTQDDIGTAYVRLALAIEQHQPGYIDGFFGPAAWKTRAEMEGKLSLTELSSRALTLARSIKRLAAESQRTRYLAKQVAAMQTTLRILAGESVPYLDEVEQVYDISPERVDETVLEEARRALESLLPGDGSLNERLRERRRRFQVGNEAAAELFEIASVETRRRTRRLFSLPEDEAVEIRFVGDKPWSAYNWYLGNGRSLVEINSDSPFQANGIVGLMTHEAYPGHHTEHAIKEHGIYKGLGWPEASVLLINAPECVVSEGIATTADEVIFVEGEVERWQRAELYPRAGVHDDLSPDEVDQLRKAQRALTGASDNAALMLHVDGRPVEAVIAYLLRYSGRTRQEAERSIRFLTEPLSRSYTFTYSVGRALLGKIFRQHDRIEVFRRLLSEPLTPADLADWPPSTAP